MKSKIVLSIIAAFMVVCLLFSGQPWTVSAANLKNDAEYAKTYLSDVKMFYGTSEDKARKACEGEGYIFSNTNLNEGAPKSSGESPMKIYLGYKTTTDPALAITDLTLLDMRNTHFEEGNYYEYLEKHTSDFTNEANQLMVMVREFRRLYAEGSPNAKKVYDSLNLIYVDESKSHDKADNLLGNYFLNEADKSFFEKFIQRGNAMVLNKIVGLLCIAVADYEADGTTWVDRAKASEIDEIYAESTSAVQNEFDSNYQDDAKYFLFAVRNFAENYTEAKKRYDQYGETLGYSELEKGMNEEEALSALNNAGSNNRFPEYCKALEIYALLDNFQYQKKGEVVVSNADLLEDGEVKKEKYTETVTLAEYILGLANDESVDEHLSTVYPIIASLSLAQRVALRKGGIATIVEGLYLEKDYDSKREKSIKTSMDKLKENGCKDGRMYLWMGVDFSVYQKKVAYTSNDIEVRLSGDDLQQSLEDAQRIQDIENIRQILDWIEVGGLAISGISMLLAGILGNTLMTVGINLFTAAAPLLAAGVLSAVGGIAMAVAATLLCAMQICAIVAFFFSMAYMIWDALGCWGLFESRDEISYDNIPDIVFDARAKTDGNGNYEVRYDAVLSNADEKIFDDYYDDNISKDHADMNAFQSVYDRWMTLYYSKSPAAGEPIEVKEGENPFITRGSVDPPSGYKPLTLINQKSACNVNDVEVDKEWGKPLYVFFPGVATGTAAQTDMEDGEYIVKLMLYYKDKKEDVLNYLRKGGFEYLDVNLTPGSGYTYLGYQKAKKGTPITDIRVCSNGGAAQMKFGDALYSQAGLEDGSGSTPYGLTLYYSKSESVGSKITDITIENQRRELGDGYEPVCLFNGGNAVDFEHDWRDNINSKFLDEEDYFMSRFNGQPAKYESEGKKKEKAKDFIQQDDPVNGKYIYFLPKTKYLAKDEDGNAAQQYIAGFSYFLAGDKNASSNSYGNNYEFMQTFAKENGFELLMDGNDPFTVMSDSAGEMTLAYTWRDTEGYPADTYHFDKVHTIFRGETRSASDHGLTHSLGFANADEDAWYFLTRENKNMIYSTRIYFGVSYTYNPKRAITGVAGLITPYSETKGAKIQYTAGLETPAGAMQMTNVSLQGQPVVSAGIGLSIYNPATMKQPLYTNYTASQKSDLPWMTKDDTEIMTHHLLSAGPRKGVLPLKKGDITFSTQENPGNKSGYIPVCDMRTPSDTSHPMNFALDTTNKGSKYLYLYLKTNAGGRENEENSNVYNKKKYVAGVFCGVGENTEEALGNLYKNMLAGWSTIASKHSDISATPTLSELDEIIPVDISGRHQWHTLHKNDSDVDSLPDDEVVIGNEAAYYRWDDGNLDGIAGSADDNKYEANEKCAYIGVIRTDDSKDVVYGLLKYYTSAATGPSTLDVGGTGTTLAGGPVDSPEGRYFLYYSTNSGTSAYSAPVTEIDISKDIFLNGYNTSFCVTDKDYVDNQLPAYSELRMRADENYYFHLGYERADLPYYEKICIGVGNSKNEAFADLIGTTTAFGAMDVNCNYNSFSKKWIAIGYRRTANASDAIRDVFLYYGDNPQDVILIKGGYSITEPTSKVSEFTFTPYSGSYRDKDFKKVKVDAVPYFLVEHAVPGGAEEPYSLNEGNGCKGIYLYYTTARFAYAQEREAEVFPITSMVFTYGDISPRYASAQNLLDSYYKAYYAKSQYDVTEFENPHWESVLGVEGSAENWNLSGKGGKRISLNEGAIPGRGNSGWHTGDKRVYMYVDRMDYAQIKPKKNETPVTTEYRIRTAAKPPEFGYYSPTSKFGKIKQSK